MQVLVPRCGRVFFHYISLIQSRTHSISSSFAACFRSTPTSFEKWKSKGKNSLEFRRPKPSKTYIQHKKRQTRADAEKALNDLLFRIDAELLKKKERKKCDDQREDTNKGDPFKNSGFHASKALHQEINIGKQKEDFDFWTNYHATFGNRLNSWSTYFKLWGEYFSQSQFEWIEDADFINNRYRRGTASDNGSTDNRKKRYKWRTANDDKYTDNTNRRYKGRTATDDESTHNTKDRNKWKTASDDESDDDDESCFIGSNSDRITLGLPVNTPLQIDEVKNAFRISALKWHPDRHQGPSQTLAAEKFKLCASAYESLCNAVSRV